MNGQRFPVTGGAGFIVDPSLPQLGAALDAAGMSDVFAESLFTREESQRRYQVHGCEIIQARYKPGRNCLLSYRLSIVDAETNQACEQIRGHDR